MDTFKADLANILLMIASTLLAINLPFELFLISYAVLGPLHYATEISWLQKKHYFIDDQSWRILAPIYAILTAAIIFFNHLTFSAGLTFLAFCLALIFLFNKSWWHRLNLLAVALFIALTLQSFSLYIIIFGILLTTIIHVWFFTGIFILSGSIRSKNISGYFAFLIFLLCSLSFFFIDITNYKISTQALSAIETNLNLNRVIRDLFNLTFSNDDLISSSSALKLQAFIAFAYTYHYLNWFSKVEIIKWHKVSKNALILSVTIWIIAVSLYAHNYRTGASFLLFLSILHVFLELPLNFISIKNLFKK